MSNFRYRILTVFLAFLIASPFCHAQQELFEHFTKKDGLKTNVVYDVVNGDDGQMWFATADGICSFNGLTFQMYGQKAGLLDLNTLGLHKDASGRLWCYTSSGKIFYYQGGKFSPLAFSQTVSKVLSERIINTIYVERGGWVWISTVIAGKLYRVSPAYSIQETTIDDNMNFSCYVKEIENDGFIWGSCKGVTDNNRLKFILGSGSHSISLSEKGGYSRSRLIKLNNGTFLFAKDHELVNLGQSGVISRTFVEKGVQDIWQDKEGKVWVALYQGGVICYPDGNISSGSPIRYLGGKTVSAIAEDNTGNMWFATLGNGIYHLPARPMLTYAPPVIYSNTNKDEVEDISNPIIIKNQPEVSEVSDFRVISTDTARYGTIPPTIFISGLKIMGLDTVVQTHYDLPYDQNFITISYVGFAYNNPEILQYKYILEGVDEHTVYSSNTYVQYTTLPPGKYRFKVSAMNKNGYWSESPAIITFTLHPPFWKTWWFITLVISAGALLVAMVLIIWIRQVRKKERERAMIKKRIADIELQALRAQMNPHFIFNTMSSIQHYITNSDMESALKYLSKFAKLMRSIMDNSRHQVITIKDEMYALKLYLDLESLRFKSKITYKIDVDDSIDEYYDKIPAMLIQPYVENAILHGITHKNGKGKVAVELVKNNGMLVCTIADDGIGRRKSRELNEKKTAGHRSQGMSITKERLEIINSLRNSDLSVNITDLEDKTGVGIGTKVEIFIPTENI